MEYLDVLDEQGQLTGEKKTSEEIHRVGLIHKSVHIWILNSSNQFLLQKRSSKKEAYPNCWDISAAGHVSAGETNIEAASRELYEELGITLLSPEELNYLFTIREQVVLNQGTYIVNEFQDIYLIHKDISLSNLELQSDEVQEVKWISITEFRAWVEKKNTALTPHLEEYTKLLERLN